MILRLFTSTAMLAVILAGTAALAAPPGLGPGAAAGNGGTPSFRTNTLVELASGLASHRAIYTMSLESASRSSGVVGARGAMAYRFTKGCDGWASETRTTILVQHGTGEEVNTEWTFANWESNDGLRYRYRLRNSRNGRVVEQIQGQASLEGAGEAGTATYSVPKGKSVPLPAGTLFPTQHLLALIVAGRAGKVHLSKIVFDGSSLDNPFEVSAVIGRMTAKDHKAMANRARLADMEAWRVRMAFFPVIGRESVPDFEISVTYRTDGIADRIKQDYGDFVLDLVLSEVETLTPDEC